MHNDIQNDDNLAIARKYANGDCSSPLEDREPTKPKFDWAALFGGLIALGFIWAALVLVFSL